MKQTIRHIGMFIFMHIICCALHAQRFTNITLDGAQTVYAIMQDSQGLMWIGTDAGLFSYDGYHGYRHFGDCTVANTRVNALAQQSNMLYLATANGLQAFDLDTYAYRPSTATAAGTTTTRKTPTELRVIDLRHGSDGYGSDVYALLPTRRGLLKGTISGLYLGRRQIAFCPGTQPLVNALAYDAHRRCYWIGTEGALYRADLQLKSFPVSTPSTVTPSSALPLLPTAPCILAPTTASSPWLSVVPSVTISTTPTTPRPFPTTSCGHAMSTSGRMCG